MWLIDQLYKKPGSELGICSLSTAETDAVAALDTTMDVN